MTSGGRIAVVLLGGVLVFLLGGIWLMLDALERRVELECLDAPAAAPPATFWQATNAGDGTLAVRYDDGLELRIPRDPKRIATSVPGITEMVAFLGRGERLVAVSKWCDYPPEVVAGVARVSVLPFNPEGFLAVQPDLLIVDRRLHRRDLAVIRQRVPHVLLLDTSRSFAHLEASFELLYQVLGADPAGTQRYRAWQARAEALQASIAGRRPAVAPRVLVVGQWDPLYVLGHGALIDDLLRILGCVNLACDLESDASGTFSEELVLARRPDWILTPAQPMPERLRQRWQNLPALRRQQLFDASGDDLVRAGPRLLEGLARLAEALLGPAPAGEAR